MAITLTAVTSKKGSILLALVLLKLAISAGLFFAFGSKAMAFSEPEFQSAFQQFAAAPGAEEKAAEAFTALLKKEPAHPVLMAYAGAATTKLAGTTMFPWKKMSYAEDGMAMLDKALQLAQAADPKLLHKGTPFLLEVKFVAANTFLAVPGFMNRAERGNKLLNEVLTDAQFEKTASGFRGAVWMRAAGLAMQQKRNADARRFLESVIHSEAPQSAAAKAMLKEVA
ncbi:hypothetical protein [Undibacterium parvum]|uniref:Tetratricopeptide repeat protein n=1 Tax=Undibacterium parvum TaxID=401471 RepID=A0A3S9HKD0_9BURK|nr:hypothetical protein [Undibacterium parvum]AZP12556.1 hypothetical protein EJN92_11390 [Undibacterium parvum]